MPMTGSIWGRAGHWGDVSPPPAVTKGAPAQLIRLPSCSKKHSEMFHFTKKNYQCVLCSPKPPLSLLSFAKQALKIQ